MKISAIDGDEVVVVGSYGPSQNDLRYVYKCRGRVISRTKITDQDSHGKYRFCVFADTGQWAWINEENIRGYRRDGSCAFGGISDVEEAA
jgi:hypothetical protein